MAARTPRDRPKRLAAALALAFGLGCGVMDELDQGRADMEKRSPTFRKEQEEKEAAAAAGAGSHAGAASAAGAVKKAAASWWKSAKSLSSEESEADIVRCLTRDGEQFMLRTECNARGGRAIKRGN
jgi:hypothetical protein